MKVCILYDGVPEAGRADQADALVQAEVVERALQALGHSSIRREFHLDMEALGEELQTLEPLLVFNLVESARGQGSLIHLAPALLDSLGIPYTGAPQTGIYTTSNKILAKRMMRLAGIPTPEWISSQERLAAQPGRAVNGKWIVKSQWEHASVGLSDDSVLVPSSRQDLLERLQLVGCESGGGWFAEAYIEGGEFNVSLLERDSAPEVIAVSEIRFLNFQPGKPRILGYASKWEIESFEYRNSVRSFDLSSVGEGLVDQMRACALDCWNLFQLRGYARVDFRVDQHGVPWVLEVNANPGLSPDAGFYAALDESGIGFLEGISRIVRAADSSARK